ncbi:uncharacterized protein LOC102809332 [Saccoglossus kowalevskii]|uniref:Ecdysone-induced protein 78C-like n=1 Tax=Saccoglossus kowalevskii TaxID=10224 RepID=A0ABM0M5G8_SACKO|nr:PREDICTED: ecdysone-induced protein 78C-like [Saccoglossus kowalevskii]
MTGRLLTYMGDDSQPAWSRYCATKHRKYGVQNYTDLGVQDCGLSVKQEVDDLSSSSLITSSAPQSSTPTSPTSKIACQVCGDISSGLHFGVYTCEGCKCFYRRSIREGAHYMCSKTNNCNMTPDTRNSCRYCRFYRCLALGMSPEGIKLGRRPKLDTHQSMCKEQGRSVTTLKMKLKQTPAMKMYQRQLWTRPYMEWNHNIEKEKEFLRMSSHNYPLKSSNEVPSSCTIASQWESAECDLNTAASFDSVPPKSPINITTGGQSIKRECDWSDSSVSDDSILSCSPVSPTLPEVIYGAAQALAFANMYRQDHETDNLTNTISDQTPLTTAFS